MAYKQCYLAIFGKGVWVSKIARDFYKKKYCHFTNAISLVTVTGLQSQTTVDTYYCA